MKPVKENGVESWPRCMIRARGNKRMAKISILNRFEHDLWEKAVEVGFL